MQPPGALGPRTRDVGEMFGDALRHHRAHLGLLFGVAFVVQVPSLIVTFLGAPSTEYAAYLTPPGAVRATSLEAGWLLIAGLVALAVAPFSAGAIYRAAADVVAGRPPTVAAALNAVLHRYFEVWVVLLAYVLGGIALIVPPLGIWLLFRWSMSLPALFEEDGGGIAALGRSWALVRKRWWRTLGVLLVAGILAALVGAAIAGVLGALAGALPGTALEIRLGALARAIASAVVGPFPALVAVLLYLDLRTRSAGVPPSAPN